MTNISNFDATLTHDNFFKKLDAATEPEEKQKDELAPLTTFLQGGNFMKKEFPEQKWLIEGVIPEQGLVCLSGMPSSYKSWFEFYLTLCIMRGESVLPDPSNGRLGWKARKGKVLIIDKENIEAQIQKRYQMFGAGEEMDNCYFLQGNFTTENIKVLASAVEFVRAHKIDLVVIDSLVRIHSRNENEAVEMNKVFERLAEFQKAGAAVLYLHHLRKSSSFAQEPMERLRGSVDISARLDSLIAFECQSPKNMIAVTHGKSRYGEAVPKFLMTFTVENGKAYFSYKKEVEEETLKQASCEDAIVAMLRDSQIRRSSLKTQLVEQGTYTDITFKRALTNLINSGIITTWRNGEGSVYSLVKQQTLTDFVTEKPEDLPPYED